MLDQRNIVDCVEKYSSSAVEFGGLWWAVNAAEEQGFGWGSQL